MRRIGRLDKINENRFEITKRKLLLTEGKDDTALFVKFLGDLGINDVQVTDIDGKDRFNEILPVIFISKNFRNLKSLGIIRDAEKCVDNPQNSALNAYESIFNILKKNNRIKEVLGRKIDSKDMNKWKHGSISVGIFIICKPGYKYGMLEDLCLDTIRGTSEMKCVENFLRCVRGDSTEPNFLYFFRNPSKNKILAYLASQEEAHGSISVAAEKGIWNINNPSFNELKDFLEEFRNMQ